MRLFEVKFELFGFAISLSLLILLPILDALLVPLLHEAGIPLQLIDLNAAHFLLSHVVRFLFLLVKFLGQICLSRLLIVELLHVRLHVELLLRLVKRVDSHLEKVVLDLVVLAAGHCNFLSRLVVPKLTCLGQNGDICGRVDLVETHFELVEEAQGQASFSFHDPIDQLRIKFDV